MNPCQRAREFAARNLVWLIAWGLTLVIFVSAVIIFYHSATLEEASQGADFISGFAAALAFLWLVVGLRLQSNQIQLQREELRLQRIALENQAKEMKTTAKFAGLSQTEAILERCARQVIESGLEIKDASEIYMVWMKGLVRPEGMNQARAWSHPGNREELEEACDDEGDPEHDKDDTESAMPAVVDVLAREQTQRLGKKSPSQSLRSAKARRVRI